MNGSWRLRRSSLDLLRLEGGREGERMTTLYDLGEVSASEVAVGIVGVEGL